MSSFLKKKKERKSRLQTWVHSIKTNCRVFSSDSNSVFFWPPHLRFPACKISTLLCLLEAWHHGTQLRPVISDSMKLKDGASDLGGQTQKPPMPTKMAAAQSNVMWSHANWVFYNGSGLFQQENEPFHTQLLRKGLRTWQKVWGVDLASEFHRFQFTKASVMSRTNKFDPWRLHVAAYGTCCQILQFTLRGLVKSMAPWSRTNVETYLICLIGVNKVLCPWTHVLTFCTKTLLFALMIISRCLTFEFRIKDICP